MLLEVYCTCSLKLAFTRHKLRLIFIFGMAYFGLLADCLCQLVAANGHAVPSEVDLRGKTQVLCKLNRVYFNMLKFIPVVKVLITC